MNRRSSISIFVLIFLLATIGMIGYYFYTNKSSKNISTQILTDPTATSITYSNIKYGFNFVLPISWNGYSIVIQEWEGNLINGQSNGKITGPEIIIRHPLWTAFNTRQDIPILIFTMDQWKQVEQENLSLGAAPIPPGELGRNTKYVFALPARYNFAYSAGFEEVEKILESKPLNTF